MNQQLFLLQARWAALGFYTGTIDGLYGPATERAQEAMTAALEKLRGITPLRWPRLDPSHAYLRKIIGLPLITVAGLDILGTIEVAGAGSSKLIMSWRDELNIPRANFPNDGIPWCGLGAGIMAKRAGKDISAVGNVLWAKNWLNFGSRVDRPMLGDIMVWQRTGGGGHVNQYVGESVQNGILYYHGLGANQDDQVNISRRRADVGFLGARRAEYRVQPASVKRYAAGTGAPIAGREA